MLRPDIFRLGLEQRMGHEPELVGSKHLWEHDVVDLLIVLRSLSKVVTENEFTISVMNQDVRDIKLYQHKKLLVHIRLYCFSFCIPVI